MDGCVHKVNREHVHGEASANHQKREILPLAATRLEPEDTTVTKRVWPSSSSPLTSGSEDAYLRAEEVACGFQALGREWR